MDFRALAASQVYGLAAAASAVAVLLFLLRPRPKAVVVPSMFFWDQVVSRRRDPRWREVLALLLQVLALAAMAFALGDPAPRDDPGEAASAAGRPVRPADRVAVVDLSPSLDARGPDGRTRLDIVRDGLLRDVDLLADGERLALVVAADRGRVAVPLTSDVRRLALALRSLHAGLARADVPGALAAASALPGLGERPAEVRLYTDGDAPSPPPLPAGTRYVLQPVGEPLDNLAVTALDARASEGLPAQHEALVRIRSFASRPAEVTLSIETAREVLGSQRVRLAPGETVERVYRFFPRGDQTIEAALRDAVFEGDGGGDALPGDDRAYAFLQPLRPARVLLISRGNLYLEKALALIPGLAVTRVPAGPAAESALAAGGADLAFLDGWAPARPPRIPTIYFNPPPGSASGFTVLRRVETPVTTDWALDHPLLRHLVLRDLNIALTSVFEPRKGDTRLVGTAGGPIALARDLSGTPVVAFGFDLGDSDLPLRVAFPQLVYNAVTWAREGRAVGGAPGRAWLARDLVPLGGTGAAEARLVAWTGGEDEAAVDGAADGGGGGAEAPRWSRPRPTGDGVARIEAPRLGFLAVQAGQAPRPLAVNLFDPEESDLRRVPAREGVDPAAAEGPPPPRPHREEPVAPWLLLSALALGVLLVEYAVGAR